RSERLLFDLDERRLGHGSNGRGARLTRQEADLPESRAGVQDRQLAALTRGPLDRDGDLPRLDQEHRGAAVSLAHDDLARGITDLSRSFDEPLALRIRKRGEELGRADRARDRGRAGRDLEPAGGVLA